MAGRIVVETASWADPGFVADWYPRGLPAAERLPWYARHFEGVEVNATFYAVPRPEAVEGWARATPRGFGFDVKLHRLLSRHAAPLDSLPRDLRGRAETNERGRVLLTEELELALVERLLDALEPLERAGKLSSLLLQLSPSFSPRSHRIDELDPLIAAVRPRRLAIEFRRGSWLSGSRCERTLGELSERDVAVVCVDGPEGAAVTIVPPVDAVTTERLAYLRAHGRNAEGYTRRKSVAERFDWDYSDEELDEIAGRLRSLAKEAQEVRMSFNNNRSNYAPRAAERMREKLERRRRRAA